MADLTINYQREMVVDFTMPFLDLGKNNLILSHNEVKPWSNHPCILSDMKLHYYLYFELTISTDPKFELMNLLDKFPQYQQHFCILDV